MDNKKLTIGAAALTAIVISAGLATSTFAYQGNPNVEGPNFTTERHAEMTAAFLCGVAEIEKGTIIKVRLI